MELETEKHSLEQAQARVFSDSVKFCCAFFRHFFLLQHSFYGRRLLGERRILQVPLNSS